jgi:DNA-binding Lrp family transcriptional regulator
VSAEAFILIETSVGRVKAVAEELRSMPGVESAVGVSGPYDVVAVVSGPDLNAVGELVSLRIHAVNGVVRTVTCLSLDSQ